MWLESVLVVSVNSVIEIEDLWTVEIIQIMMLIADKDVWLLMIINGSMFNLKYVTTFRN